MNLFENEYDGELNFEIVNSEIGEDAITMELSADYKGETVGFSVSVPIVKRRALFKSIVMLQPTNAVRFERTGEQSDRFVRVLDEIWNPEFEVSGAFSETPMEFEFSVLNKELYDCLTEKNYLRVYYDIRMETGDAFDDYNMEMGFNFNLSRGRASLVERKRALRNDFAALIMA